MSTVREHQGDRVRVVLTYRAPTDVPLIGRLLGPQTIRSSATMRIEIVEEAAQVAQRTRAIPSS